MIHFLPGSEHACTKVRERLRGGRAAFKGDLLLHAARLDVAMRHGFRSWPEYDEAHRMETAHWMENFCKEIK